MLPYTLPQNLFSESTWGKNVIRPIAPELQEWHNYHKVRKDKKNHPYYTFKGTGALTQKGAIDEPFGAIKNR